MRTQKIIILWFISLTMLTACSHLHTRAYHSPTSHYEPIRIPHEQYESGSQELMIQALSLVGTPYRYGGTDRSEGFDCSGMVQYLYQNTLQVALPRTARDIASVARRINIEQLQVGDLVFFNTNGQPFSHMGIYIGDGEFIHAPSSNKTIRRASLKQQYFQKRFNGAFTLFEP